MPLSFICDPGCWEDGDAEACGRAKAEPCPWLVDISLKHQASRRTAVLESSQEPNCSMKSTGSHSVGGALQLVTIDIARLCCLSEAGWLSFRHSSSRGFGTLPPTYNVTVGTWSGRVIEGSSRHGQTSVVTTLA